MKLIVQLISLFLVHAITYAQSKNAVPDKAAVKNLQAYVGKNVRYPPLDQENGRYGRVLLTFTVDTGNVVRSVEVINSFSSSSSTEVLRVFKKSDPGKFGLPFGKYTVGINFKLMDQNNQQLETTFKKARLDRRNTFLFTVDVMGYLTRRHTSWIVDRISLTNFSNDFKGKVRSAVINFYRRKNDMDSLWKTNHYMPAGHNYISSIKQSSPTAKRKDTIYIHGKIRSINKLNRKGQVMQTVFYSNHRAQSKKTFTYHGTKLKETKMYSEDGTAEQRTTYSYFNNPDQLLLKKTYNAEGNPTEEQQLSYRQNRLIEDKQIRYSKTGDTLVLTNKFAYDQEGRKIEERCYFHENRDIHENKLPQKVIYTYMDWDENGNWQKAVRTDNLKITDIVKRQIIYDW